MINKVFVYGTLKRHNGVRGMNLMVDATFISETKSKDPLFDLYDLGSFPAVQPGGTSYIQGEIWEITNDVLDVLDHIEGYPNFYNRQIIETDNGPAWMYYIADAHKMRTQKIQPDKHNIVKWNDELTLC
jgi:gamma-glutamylcyclotransferase (GGCT)/AIG2-like uncharacterized protein YtfP